MNRVATSRSGQFAPVHGAAGLVPEGILFPAGSTAPIWEFSSGTDAIQVRAFTTLYSPSPQVFWLVFTAVKRLKAICFDALWKLLILKCSRQEGSEGEHSRRFPCEKV